LEEGEGKRKERKGINARRQGTKIKQDGAEEELNGYTKDY
jgi:hypothetical protein